MAKLYFYYSAMNAGKTANLLQANYNYRERNQHTLLFKPRIACSQPLEPIIKSRTGLSAEAVIFTEKYNFYRQILHQIDNENVKCILIDEAQFLTKSQVFQLGEIVSLGIPVLCYGLRTDFKGEPFEGAQYLLAWADKIVEIKTVCWCGAKATFNQRIDNIGRPLVDGDQIEIGGNEKYISTCRKHFTFPI